VILNFVLKVLKSPPPPALLGAPPLEETSLGKAVAGKASPDISTAGRAPTDAAKGRKLSPGAKPKKKNFKKGEKD
jgi:hypothetical protein